MNREKERYKRKSIEKTRAKAAYDYVEAVINENYKDKYKSHVQKLAPFIKTNGLGNTIAFIYSKKNNEAYKKIYEQLNKWFIDNEYMKGDLLNEIVNTNSREYRQLTKESLALINWWRRFVEGMIEEKKEENGG